jgi:hypothetical protein
MTSHAAGRRFLAVCLLALAAASVIAVGETAYLAWGALAF